MSGLQGADLRRRLRMQGARRIRPGRYDALVAVRHGVRSRATQLRARVS